MVRRHTGLFDGFKYSDNNNYMYVSSLGYSSTKTNGSSYSGNYSTSYGGISSLSSSGSIGSNGIMTQGSLNSGIYS
jgi:hypothetical protein